MNLSDIFLSLTRDYGPEILGQPQRVLGLMADRHPKEKYAHNLTKRIYEAKIVEELRCDGGPHTQQRMIQKLMDEYSISETSAEEAILAVCKALNLPVYPPGAAKTPSNQSNSPPAQIPVGNNHPVQPPPGSGVGVGVKTHQTKIAWIAIMFIALAFVYYQFEPPHHDVSSDTRDKDLAIVVPSSIKEPAQSIPPKKEEEQPPKKVTASISREIPDSLATSKPSGKRDEQLNQPNQATTKDPRRNEALIIRAKNYINQGAYKEAEILMKGCRENQDCRQIEHQAAQLYASLSDLIGNARAFIVEGEYDKAKELMTACSASSKDCQQLESQAVQLDEERLDCVSSSGEWVNGNGTCLKRSVAAN